MKGAILYTESDMDLNLILQLAKKPGISAKKLSKEEIEDCGLSLAISEGKTGEYINTDSNIESVEDACIERIFINISQNNLRGPTWCITSLPLPN